MQWAPIRVPTPNFLIRLTEHTTPVCVMLLRRQSIFRFDAVFHRRTANSWLRRRPPAKAAQAFPGLTSGVCRPAAALVATEATARQF